ncbi:MAG: hypothetical protein AAF993_04320 [Pseudomonadota bacterium]
MTTRTSGLAILLLALIVQPDGHATTELQLTAESDDVVDAMETILDDMPHSSIETASTGNFHLLMAQLTNGSFVTITFAAQVREVADTDPVDLTAVTIRTDSPVDQELESSLAQALMQATAVE